MRVIQLFALMVAAVMSGSAAERYASVVIDQGGKVTVVTQDGRHITPPADDDQIGAEKAAVAPDQQAVGWLALYPFCCTSYPLPLRLMILSDGQVHKLRGSFEEPIWFWTFQDGGKHVAFKEETPHGSQGLHYELWDVTSGRRIADYAPKLDFNGHVVARPNEPKWVQALDAEHEKQR